MNTSGKMLHGPKGTVFPLMGYQACPFPGEHWGQGIFENLTTDNVETPMEVLLGRSQTPSGNPSIRIAFTIREENALSLSLQGNCRVLTPLKFNTQCPACSGPVRPTGTWKTLSRGGCCNQKPPHLCPIPGWAGLRATGEVKQEKIRQTQGSAGG